MELGIQTAPSTNRDQLIEALFPVLLHRLNNSTQLIASLNALLALDGGDDIVQQRADDLARSSSTVHQLGWLLAALASAGGSDLMLARREARGLEWMLSFTGEAVRRLKRHPRLPLPESIPDLAPQAFHGWEVPWAVGTLWLASAASVPVGSSVTLAIETGPGDALELRMPLPQNLEALTAKLSKLLPGLTIRAASKTCTLQMPAAWFRPVGLHASEARGSHSETTKEQDTSRP